MSATNRGTIRNERDFYVTPLTAFTPLLPYLPVDCLIFEPAQGDGRLVHAMKDTGRRAHGNDIVTGFDFLKSTIRHECIVTNPPFSLAFEFVQHANHRADHTYLLLRLNFLASRKRRSWFISHEPSALFVLSQRPSFDGIGTDATDYAWFYWGDTHKGIMHL